ncbi:MAG: SAM-dependent chlorinase/fluorinase [Desulfobulbaceae bacterium]|nr:SAM-dependent chlorinase/fluorinase [Desulfobulbaceae bacterium]HIJ78640.1 SAM-dependent chlorinase/fluorinase [Deltaproteobacteria bacterium]
MSPIITLTTDFGLADEYVGVMKGIILGRAPQAKLVDICHKIKAQDIEQAAFVLQAAAPYFPPDTIHLVVVDPGVGTNRRLLALRAGGQYFVAPDNGVLTHFLTDDFFEEAVYLDCPRLYLTPLSNTFHGRDIMAPVAAALANNISFQDLGNNVIKEQLTKFILPELQIDAIHGNISGVVIQIDHFGNLTTNIHQRDIERLSLNPAEIEIVIKQKKISGLTSTYGTDTTGKLQGLIGSRGFLEIAVTGGSAAELLKTQNHDPVKVLAKKNP